MAASNNSHEPVTGGCLCGQVRYTIEFPNSDSWPPQAHTCQCTQCRKQTGALFASFITVHPKTVKWAAFNGLQTSDFPPSFREFHSSEHGRRSFCSDCGCAISWRHAQFEEEIEILVGSIDEKWLIGDRTERVKSEDLTKPGAFEQVLRDEGDIGKDLCYPAQGNFYVRNAVKGVTDSLPGGKRWIENTEAGFAIPE